jgi:type I restriction enzyme, S subunit
MSQLQGEQYKRPHIEKKMVLVTRSGTVGRSVLVPKHWEQWVANEHIIRIDPT